MKKILTGVVILLFAATAYADWNRDGWGDTESNAKERVQDDSGYQSATAQQPGIGDSSQRFGQTTFSPGYVEQDDWSNLNSEEIYGAF